MREALPGDGAASTAGWLQGTPGWPRGDMGVAAPQPKHGDPPLLAPTLRARQHRGAGTGGLGRGWQPPGTPPLLCPQHRWPRTPQKPNCSGGASQPPSHSPSHGGPGVPPPRLPASPHKRSRAMLAFPPVFPNVLGLIRSRSAFAPHFTGQLWPIYVQTSEQLGAFFSQPRSPSPRRLAPRARGRAGTPDLF